MVQAIESLTTTQVQDPTKFAFFQGVNTKAVNGILSVNVTNGLPEGTYRLSSINAAANHQPVLVAVAQHAALDDMIYVCISVSSISPSFLIFRISFIVLRHGKWPANKQLDL